jgi:hypothetical protein
MELLFRKNFWEMVNSRGNPDGDMPGKISHHSGPGGRGIAA